MVLQKRKCVIYNTLNITNTVYNVRLPPLPEIQLKKDFLLLYSIETIFQGTQKIRFHTITQDTKMVS